MFNSRNTFAICLVNNAWSNNSSTQGVIGSISASAEKDIIVTGRGLSGATNRFRR
jgi:hypothetical protein